MTDTPEWDMLFLTVYTRRAGYFDGATYVALVEADDEDAARLHTASQFCDARVEPDEDDYHEDREEHETAAELAGYEARLAEWRRVERLRLGAERAESLRTHAARVEAAPANGRALLVATERSTYDDR